MRSLGSSLFSPSSSPKQELSTFTLALRLYFFGVSSLECQSVCVQYSHSIKLSKTTERSIHLRLVSLK